MLEHIKWKRDIKIIELDIEPIINRELELYNGMIELTKGYKTLTQNWLFDVDSKLEKEQVKSLYCSLEKKFALSCKGDISISKDILLKGSVMREVCIPALEKNSVVNIKLE